MDIALIILSEYIMFDIISFIKNFNSSTDSFLPFVSYFAAGLISLILWIISMTVLLVYYSNNPYTHYN